MKWYSHTTYRQHMKDMEVFKDDDVMRQAYQNWPKTLSNRFDKSYPRVGILDQLDLLQEGYVGFYKAWSKLNWDLVNERIEDERIGMITNYLKNSIKRHIVRAIARDRDTIRIPESYYSTKWWNGTKMLEYQTDVFLTRTFSTFFDESILDRYDDSIPDHVADELNELLNDFMDEILKPIEKTVIKMFYGIDEPWDKKCSINQIASKNYITDTNVKVIKHRAINKLKENKELIKNKYQDIVTN